MPTRLADPAPVFLTAEWRSLVVLNYDVEETVLAPYVPPGTELDLWEDRAVVSLVGFRFLATRLRGWPIPWHRDFDEVNLRFYVRRRVRGAWRRGVVFLREIVARRAVAWVANSLYHERYACRPVTHDIALPTTAHGRGRVRYAMRDGGQPLELSAEIAGSPTRLEAGSEAEFILDHYYGYTHARDGSTREYLVEHPPWRVWQPTAATFYGDCTALYGPAFASVLCRPPHSAIVAEGSAVAVREGRVLADCDFCKSDKVAVAAMSY